KKEEQYNKLRKIKEKLKQDDIKLFMSFFTLSFDDIEYIIERKPTEEELDFFIENFNGGPQYPQNIIPYNRRIMQMFIARFPMN
ncbi:6177_t:CDS:1, partial [Cetraspora pellucida]